MTNCKNCIKQDVCNRDVGHGYSVCPCYLSSDVEEVKRSEWILRKDGSGTCKRCGFTQKNVWDYDNWQNFCGHCGANMMERKEKCN